MSSKKNPNDPYSTFNFTVELDGLGLVAGFSECSGLYTEPDKHKHRKGEKDIFSRKVAELDKPINISLKRGLTYCADAEFWKWLNPNTKIERKGGTIVLRDKARQEVSRWTFREGFVVSSSNIRPDAIDEGYTIESLNIAIKALIVNN